MSWIPSFSFMPVWWVTMPIARYCSKECISSDWEAGHKLIHRFLPWPWFPCQLSIHISSQSSQVLCEEEGKQEAEPGQTQNMNRAKKNQITTIGLTSNSLNNSCLVLKYRTIADWLDMALISCLWDLRWQKCKKSWFKVKWYHSFLFLLIGSCYQVVNIIYTLQHNISAESCQ